MLRESEYLGKKLVIFGMLILALTASLPVLVDYNIVGEQLVFYLEEMSRMVLLQRMGISVDNAYRLLIGIVNVATVGVAYASFAGTFRSRGIGMLGCILYTLSPCRLQLVYRYSAVGEYTAMIFLPLLVWGMYRICCSGRKEKGYWRSWLILAAGIVGTVLAYGISAVPFSFAGQSFWEREGSGMGAMLWICLLLWIYLMLTQGDRVVSERQKTERRITNVAWVLGCLLPGIHPAFMGMATLCMVVAACMTGVWMIREKNDSLPAREIVVTVALLGVVFGTWQVNEILLTGAEIIRSYIP